MLRVWAIAAVLVILGVVGGTWYYTRSDAEDVFAACRGTAVAGGVAKIGGPFELVDETGKTVTDEDVITGPTLIYFGYTYCPDVCPMDMARNVEAIEILDEKGIKVKPVFISIDPERDTPEQLAEFTDYLHPDLLGLSGTPEQVKAASQAYRTYYKKNAPEDADDEFYLVDHSTFTYLMFPGLGLADFFRRDMTPEEMADKIACFVDASA